MADHVDVLDADPRASGRVWMLVAVLLLAVLGGGLLLRHRPAAPFSLQLERLDGSALQGESFVRLHLRLVAEGASGLDDVRLQVAGADQLGQHATRFDGAGRVTVQVDLTPRCGQVAAVLAAGTLAVQVRDSAGDQRLVHLPVSTEGPLDRLVRYRCA